MIKKIALNIIHNKSITFVVFVFTLFGLSIGKLYFNFFETTFISVGLFSFIMLIYTSLCVALIEEL